MHKADTYMTDEKVQKVVLSKGLLFCFQAGLTFIVCRIRKIITLLNTSTWQTSSVQWQKIRHLEFAFIEFGLYRFKNKTLMLVNGFLMA